MTITVENICRICFSIICSVYGVDLFAQIDSLQSTLSETVEKQDRILILEQLVDQVPEAKHIPYLIELVDLQKQSEPDQAFEYALRAKSLAERLNDTYNLAIIYSKMARIYCMPRLQYDSALWAIDHALEILEKDSSSGELGHAYNTAGIIHADQGDLQTGIEYFKKAEITFSIIGDHCMATTIHHNIGKIYKYTNQIDLAKDYFLECLESFRRYECDENYDYLFVNLGGMFEEMGEYREALSFLHQGLKISERLNHREGVGASLLMIGKIHGRLDHYQEAEQNLREALEIAERYGIHKLNIAANYELAELWMKLGKYDQAKVSILEGLDIAKQSERLVYISTGYSLLSDYYSNVGMYEQAFQSYKKHVEVKDSMESKKVETQIASLENEKKEAQIDLLNKENEIIDLKLNRSKVYNYVSYGTIFIGLIVTLILFRNYRHKQHIRSVEIRRQADHKILEMERRILASVIDTENRERKRFSADLHDDLGPLLSSAKLYIGEIAETSGQEQMELTAHTNEIIDAAIRNTRVISNNIRPTLLSEKGLLPSLELFCEKIERVQAMRFIIQVNDNDQIDLNPGLEVVLFRVLTELINNTVRHAQATKVEISFREKKGLLDILYADDGIGFDVEDTLESSNSGMGLMNIKRRIYELHGKIEINSTAKSGTNIHIEIPV